MDTLARLHRHDVDRALPDHHRDLRLHGVPRRARAGADVAARTDPINVVSNIAFTPIQFGLRNLPLASVDILIVLVTAVWCIVAFWPYSRLAALTLTPYLVWVAMASVLQLSITWMNR